jgi:hypothetical protein
MRRAPPLLWWMLWVDADAGLGRAGRPNILGRERGFEHRAGEHEDLRISGGTLGVGCFARHKKGRGPGLRRGPCSRRVHPPPKTMSISATAFRSSHGIGPGIRWIRRAGFVGPAARGRPCGRTLLRFLAGASAGTDGSFIGRAGRGLVLSRRNERRAEERRNDKSRDCKFGSHKEDLPKITLWTPNLWQTIEF